MIPYRTLRSATALLALGIALTGFASVSEAASVNKARAYQIKSAQAGVLKYQVAKNPRASLRTVKAASRRSVVKRLPQTQARSRAAAVPQTRVVNGLPQAQPRTRAAGNAYGPDYAAQRYNLTTLQGRRGIDRGPGTDPRATAYRGYQNQGRATAIRGFQNPAQSTAYRGGGVARLVENWRIGVSS
ncbi:MAG: hypothetical protein QF511_02335 [Rhodospirillales bacterium]|jgi:hypothetical protein|nr:hypothetical protein [Rhodospirillales bacterium]MDP7214552.1 hypothetical protein [Rhodospirillales bacterium]HIJ44225.1 hypothetical protein [Rhodospirillaceae bacterium]HIJ46102.1 hypothetical protein [Rhodospirillaceae bacterium]HIJ93061.1 hypothetical protein [Rhodospirillaceae bacterium]